MAVIELQAAIPDTGWVSLPLAVGVTGTIKYRKIGNRVTLLANLSGLSSHTETELPIIDGLLPKETRPLVSMYRNAAFNATASTRRYLYAATNGNMSLQGDLTGGAGLRFEESWLTN